MNTSFRSIRTWSSLNALVYISRINEETDVLISASDLAACQTLEEIHQLLKSRLHGTD
jgi:acyl carrier protein